MNRSTRLQIIGVLAVGAALGYLAASDSLLRSHPMNHTANSEADTLANSPSKVQVVRHVDAPACCEIGPGRELLLAQAGAPQERFLAVALKQAALADDLPDTPDRTAFRSLFNGKDLSGWTTVGSAVWRVENGVIVGGQNGDPKRSGLLMTSEEFQDFELALDFMIDEHGKYNSGIYLRQQAGKGGRTGYQVNIGRGQAQEYTAGIFTDRWLDKGDEDDAIRRPGEWNSLRIMARGGHITVDLNGTNVADHHEAKPAEKFLKPGVIALQTYGADGHAGWVKFRNIKIREFR
jgi:hypothetical protein